MKRIVKIGYSKINDHILLIYFANKNKELQRIKQSIWILLFCSFIFVWHNFIFFYNTLFFCKSVSWFWLHTLLILTYLPQWQLSLETGQLRFKIVSWLYSTYLFFMTSHGHPAQRTSEKSSRACAPPLKEPSVRAPL